MQHGRKVKFCILRSADRHGNPQAPEHSVPLLTQLLEDRISRMRAQLTHIHSNNLTIAQNTQLDQLYEDIHWLLLIAGECGGAARYVFVFVPSHPIFLYLFSIVPTFFFKEITVGEISTYCCWYILFLHIPVHPLFHPSKFKSDKNIS